MEKGLLQKQKICSSPFSRAINRQKTYESSFKQGRNLPTGRKKQT